MHIIHLWVRLLDNGVMSDVFRAYMKAAKAADLEMNPLAKKIKTGGEDPIPASDVSCAARVASRCLRNVSSSVCTAEISAADISGCQTSKWMK